MHSTTGNRGMDYNGLIFKNFVCFSLCFHCCLQGNNLGTHAEQQADRQLFSVSLSRVAVFMSVCVCVAVWGRGAQSAAVLVHLVARPEDSGQGSASSGTGAGSGKG